MVKPNPVLVVLTAVWRLGIAVVALIGWVLYGADLEQLPFLTQSGNLLVAVVYLGLAFYYPIATFSTGREPGEGRIRGAMTLLLMVVGSTYIGVIEGDTAETKDLLTHVVTPVLVFVDWCFVGRSQNRTRWWHPLLWIVIPGVWLLVYSVTGGYDWLTGSALYDFADPEDDGYALVVMGLVGGTIAGGFLLYGIGKLKGAMSQSISGQQAAAGPYAGYPAHGHQQQWPAAGQPWQQAPPGSGPPQQYQQPNPYPQMPPQQQPWPPGPPR